MTTFKRRLNRAHTQKSYLVTYAVSHKPESSGFGITLTFNLNLIDYRLEINEIKSVSHLGHVTRDSEGSRRRRLISRRLAQ